jgi:hypothetical protein
MQLEKNLWLENGWYVDFDEFGQLRVIGPNNHLYCGLIDIPSHKIKIISVKDKKFVLEIKGQFISQRLNFYYPAMDDIRTMREELRKFYTFLQVRQHRYERLVPIMIKLEKNNKKTLIIFRRFYQEKMFYECSFEFPANVRVKKINLPYKGFLLESKSGRINFILRARTNDLNFVNFKKYFLISEKDFDFSVFGKKRSRAIKNLWRLTEVEIEHLIKWGKTSGDRFGTIFPRDWMESADLGVHDLTPEVRSYMYEAALKNVNKMGEGWHEDVVGEYKYEHEITGQDIFDRHMIDIEPHYLMGLELLPQSFLLNQKIREKLKAVAKYLIKQAKSPYIIFKKLPTGSGYYLSGNWRDSEWAYKKISPIIAPFDVNVVFYPVALKMIKKFQKTLNLKENLDSLIKYWQGQREKFSFVNPDKRPAYALALYGIKKNHQLIFKKMRVNHLDEAYLFAYDEATRKEVKSFCQRLLDPRYFYTPSGPLIIAKNNNFGYTTNEYHGLVIWTKQTAFTILGLSKHLKIAMINNWPLGIQALIKRTILKICDDSLNTFISLGGVPELHWDDNGKPRLFSEQPEIHLRMSKVQLWSAVGARRIIRKYYEILTEPEYQAI